MTAPFEDFAPAGPVEPAPTIVSSGRDGGDEEEERRKGRHPARDRHGTAPDSVIVLGAGVAGLAAARTLSAAGLSVTVIDQAPSCGGAHRSHQIGPYTFDLGSIFYEENAALFSLSPGVRDLCPPVWRMERRIGPEGRLLQYPLSLREIRDWPLGRKIRAAADLLASQTLRRQDGTLETICRTRLGRSSYRDTGLASYIARFHHCPASEIDEEFFFRRMSHVERSTRLRAVLATAWRTAARPLPTTAPRWPFRIRPSAGTSLLFDPIRAALEAASVRFRLQERLLQVERVPEGFVVTTTGGRHQAAALVSAIPLDTLHRALFATGSGLASIDLLSLFVSAERLDPGAGNVLFNFHASGRWKRATIHSRLYRDQQTAREFLSVEVTLPPGAAADPAEAFCDFRDHVEGLGLARGVTLEGHDVIEAAYPLYRVGDVETARRLIERIERLGIVSVGRQGRFEYLPVSSLVIRRVQEELSHSPALRQAGAA
ncbi:FAD-dependent oxidoreductase [Rhodobacter sp. NSM]|uniref:FAD-dependent oxidoreductase n=1 Tax=Rhodobacter sp. NSM TaxID=3457501 RepID=UPI003FD41DFF